MTNREAAEILRRMRTAERLGTPEGEALGMGAAALLERPKERGGSFIDRIAEKVVERIAEKLLEEAER